MEGLAEIPRRVLTHAQELLSDEPVLVLTGPRTVGKSYVLQRLARLFGSRVLDLDDVATLQAVTADPALYAGGPAPVCIDEWQHCEAIVPAIKAELNRDLRPGRFVLTGSTRSEARPILDHELAGRYHEIPVLPFSQGEIAGTTEHFAEVLLEDPSSLITSTPSHEPRAGYAGRVTAGGMPHRPRSLELGQPQPLVRGLRAPGDRARCQGTAPSQPGQPADALPRVLARLASQTARNP